MGGKQKKKKESKKEPSIFDKPMPNPFLDTSIKVKVPVKAENGKDLFEEPMENPFTSAEEKEKSQAAIVPRKTGNKALLMPKPKSWEEVSATKGWTHAVKQIPRKKKA